MAKVRYAVALLQWYASSLHGYLRRWIHVGIRMLLLAKLMGSCYIGAVFGKWGDYLRHYFVVLEKQT